MPNGKGMRRYEQRGRLKNDADLTDDARYRNHDREQQFQDSVNWLLCKAIYVVPAILLFGIVAVCIHWAWVGEWSNVTQWVERLGLVVGGYFLSELQKRGLSSKQGE